MLTPNTPIRPENIDAGKHLYDAFGHHETEVSAGWIVRFCQQRGRGWESFPLAELEAFYAKRHSDGFTFNRLTSGYVAIEDGTVTLTTHFVERCYASRPVKR